MIIKFSADAEEATALVVVMAFCRRFRISPRFIHIGHRKPNSEIPVVVMPETGRANIVDMVVSLRENHITCTGRGLFTFKIGGRGGGVVFKRPVVEETKDKEK